MLLHIYCKCISYIIYDCYGLGCCPVRAIARVRKVAGDS